MSDLQNPVDDGNFEPPIWKLYLYQLQKEAPKPAAVFCQERIENVPQQYGLEFHGVLHRRKCQDLLKKEGNYLVRCNNSAEGYFTLSLRFSGVVKHYKLYYDRQHYVGEKKFNKLEDLISDGLVTLYLESRAGKFLLQLPTANYRQSPYFTLNRSVLKALNKSKSTKIRPRPQAIYTKRNNLSPVVSGSEGRYLKSSVIKIPNEDLNIKLEKNELHPGAELDPNQLNGDHMNKMSSNESLEKLDVDDVTSERPHRFNNHTFTGLHWCGFCGNFLWGLMLQGVKCSDCGFKAHRPCSLKVPNDCCPDLKNLQCIFGMDLSTSLNSWKDSVNDETMNVPPIVTECIAEIEARGLTMEGLYRVPGSHEQIANLRLAFERDGINVCIDEKTVPDINVVAGVLKLYFRLLPIRVITSECFKKLMEANKLSVPEGRVANVKEAIGSLLPTHYHTLKAFICHLARVCEHSAINKMSATSLSTIFGPTMIDIGEDTERVQPEDLLAMKLSAQEPRVIEMLIVLHKEVFD